MVRNYIESSAEKLLLDSLALGEVPIKLEKCALHLNINVKSVPLESDVSGFLVLNEDATVIGYNNQHSEHRYRFTIAHELGHFILHRNNSRLFIEKTQRPDQRIMFRDNTSSTGEYLKEREANSFAAALLMPRKSVEEKAAEYNTEIAEDLIYALARDFNVSNQAMQIRLANLGIVDYDSLSK